MINFSVKGIKEVRTWMQTLPKGLRVAFMRAFTDYQIGNSTHGLKHEPGYKYVSPFRSYSANPAKAAKQRAWIFAHLDQIGHDNRTHALSNAWKSNETSDWTRVKITNDSNAVDWTMGARQTRQNKAVGWRKYMDVIASNMQGAFNAGLAAIRAVLKRK